MYPWGTDHLDCPDLGSKSHLPGEMARKSQAGFHVGEHLTGKSSVPTGEGGRREGMGKPLWLCVPQSWDWGVGAELLSLRGSGWLSSHPLYFRSAKGFRLGAGC